MPDHEYIYRHQAGLYDRMISFEDDEGNILKEMENIVPRLEEADAVDIGAGTGRLSLLLAPRVRSLIAADASAAMLAVAEDKLRQTGAANWRTLVADNRALPLPDRSADLITAGWTICYSASTNADQWRRSLETVMGELRRMIRPRGTIIIMETGGTGTERPNPPDFLIPYYELLVSEYGFARSWIRTDFRFETAQEAEEMCRFFFGDELADRAAAAGSAVVPGCTGVWWRRAE